MVRTEKGMYMTKGGKKVVGLILAAVVLVAVAFGAGARLAGRQTETEITADLIGQSLRSVQELATVEYHYTNMGRYENQLDFYGWAVPLTKKSFIVSYDGVIKAGVDLTDMTVTVGEEKITICLPQAEILSHEIPEDSIVVFDETNNVFNPIQIEDYTGFTRDQKEGTEVSAVEKGLLTEAWDRARETIAGVLSLIPGVEKYTIEFLQA